MKKMFPKISRAAVIAQLMTGYLAYFILLTDNGLHCSIDYLIHYAHSLPLKQHLMLLGLLPIYIAVVIFGASLLGVALSRWGQDFIVRIFKQKSQKATFTSQI